MKFAIFGNTYQAKKSSHAVTLFKLLKKQGAEIGMCREFYQFLVSENMDIKADQLFDVQRVLSIPDYRPKNGNRSRLFIRR